VNAPPGRLLPPLFEPPREVQPYASRPSSSRGRFHGELESPTRSCYQRDRDRIIHSAAFRRLKHKTQVFVQHEGDYYRTRLTHSLEVAQIARSVARVLAVDEDLAEALSLAHDLGHTPFGHAGEDALNAASVRIGGFDHNAHALRLVTRLEHRYAVFDGLNLTWEALEGLVKHNGPLLPPKSGVLLAAPIVDFDREWSLDLTSWPGIEAQIAAIADDIAYVNHDIDDALRAGLFSVDDLLLAPLAGAMAKAILDRYGALELGRFIGEIVHRLIRVLIDDLLAETRVRLARTEPKTATDVRRLDRAIVSLSPGMVENLLQLKEFLQRHMYRHPRVMSAMSVAKEVVAKLYGALVDDPSLLPADWQKGCEGAGDDKTAAVVRDYIAGMTDRFALIEYRRIFQTELEL
jgi:dGTPase